MPRKTDAAGLVALAERAGLALTPAQRSELLPAWDAIEAMRASIRSPAPGVAPGSAEAASAEPALIYRAGRGA